MIFIIVVNLISSLNLHSHDSDQAPSASGHIVKDHPLKDHHTFGLEARASHFISITSEHEMIAALAQKHSPVLLLGGGSNVVFLEDYSGLVIQIAHKGIAIVKETDEHVWVEAQAGEIWNDLVQWCIDRDFGGIENLSLIPGTVGAAPIQNIGAYGVELESVFHELRAMDRRSMKVRVFNNTECQFGYRDSIFKGAEKDVWCILSVTLRLTKKDHALKLNYGSIQEVLEKKKLNHPMIKDVSDAVVSIRQSKLPDPTLVGNAGSFFKNPLVPQSLYDLWRSRHSEIPGYPAGDLIKVPAGWLLDHLGWRGKACGGAAVYEKHALVLVNKSTATPQDLKDLIQKINRSVYTSFGIRLDPEVNLIGG